MTPIKYHEAAEDELLTEIGYLELQAKGLGRRFYAEIRRAEDGALLPPAFPARSAINRPTTRHTWKRQKI